MLSRAFLLLGAAVAGVQLARTAAAYQGALPERMALLFALKLFLLFAAALYAALTSARDRLGARLERLCERRPAGVLAAVVAASIALVLVTTPQINFGRGGLGLGYGHDGQIYGWMTEHFSWSERPVVPGVRFGYRFLPPMLVHYSGLSTFHGFELLNLLSHVLASVLAYRIALSLALPRPAALLAVALLATMKFGLKFTLYYPVLTDGLGTLLLMAIIWATLERRHLVYVLAMTAAVATRENLLALTAFNALHLIRTGRGASRFLVAAALQVIPLAAWVLATRYPLFPPASDPGLWGAVQLVSTLPVNLDRQARVPLAWLNALGVLGVLPLLSWRRVATFLGQRYEWAWYVALTVALALGGGSDLDRFFTWLAPAAVFALLAVDQAGGGPLPGLWIGWLLLHLVAMEAVLPWFPEEYFYLSRTAAHAGRAELAHVALFSWSLAATVVAVALQEEARVRNV